MSLWDALRMNMMISYQELVRTFHNNTLDKSNKIVPADPQQNQVRLQESAVSGGLFTYYVGYVSPTPKSATSGPITSWATWELVYN